MKLVFDDLNIDVGNEGFEQDKLNRKEFGQKLSALLDAADGPMVLSLDGEWGTGKSTFLKMWVGAHSRDFSGQSKVLYFDAFEHEFLDDPLTSLVLKLSDSIPDDGRLERLKRAAAKLVHPFARLGLAAATAGVSELVGPVGDAVAQSARDVSEDAIAGYWTEASGKLDAVQRFCTLLSDLASDEDGGSKRLVFVVDELDRCRPDYALQFLEVIKHFFSVPNVHFVLGANMRSLRVSVEARYGSQIGADAYLRKFIHFAVSIPEAEVLRGRSNDTIQYFKKLVRDVDLPSKLYEDLDDQLRLYAERKPLSLRDIQRIVAKALLLPAAVERHFVGFRVISVTAVLMSVLSRQHLAKIVAGRASVDLVGDFFGLNQNGEFPRPNRNTAEREVFILYHTWARIIQHTNQEPEDEETVEFTKGVFGRTSIYLSRTTLIDHIRTTVLEWDLEDFEEQDSRH
ncbi:MAG: P-loop NTPase fold protein [Pseudomonadota bacterium]